ncbi:MAG: O-antigen polymerase [Gemmatimonadota bacterium]
MDALVGLWVFALGLAGYLIFARRSGDVLHPLAVFWGSWLLVFAFAHFNVPRSFDEPYYAEPFGLVAYGATFAGLISFVSGFLLVRPGLALPTAEDRIAWETRLRGGLDVGRLGVWTVLLFLVASVTTAFFIRRAGAIPLLSPRINELRLDFKLPYWGYLYDLHFAVALFASMLAVWTRGARRWAWVGLAIASTLLLMSGGVRVSPLTALAWVIVFLTYRPGRLRLRRVVLALLIVGLVFGVIEQYRRSTFRADPRLANPRLDMGVPATLWAHSAASFKNLQFTLERVSPLYMGLTSYDLPKTLYPTAREVDQEFSYLYGTHNTPTFLSFLYFDFGWGGLLLIPALYGAVVAFVYDRFRRRPSIFWLVVYVDFLLATALAFRTHRFFGNSLIFFAGIALLTQVLVARRSDASVALPLPTALGAGAS